MEKATGWWFYVTGVHCKKEIALVAAPSPDEKERPLVPEVRTTCPHCGTEHLYSPREIDRAEME